MCGRYFVQREAGRLRDYFGTEGDLPNHPPSWNVAPTQDSWVVRRHPQEGVRHLGVLRWGLVPRWAKDASGAAKLMNARSEGLAEKPSFREAARKRRCLVPADGFYEWRQEGKGKQAYAVALRSGAPMALAGLWEGWQQPDGSWLRSFTIITTEANAKQALVHHRMPVILPREAWALWLGEEAGDAWSDALALLRPSPAEELACWPVAARVGKFAENDAGLIARDPLASPPPELDDPSPYEPR
ncbi:SOS response-associated peptidase [Roseomonas sp. GC11]|uniref:SOS response-associated peptidase n=1 Tax=Roseomonas sp. GC11 TaxID=2950546 RepID=UPI00210EAB57|nr:SOS response-associated peptidase [Roseomonas sp. GC11]MCQ4158941.1 SOS response-associated peptidase [Roseomonas sp. GC11]